MDKNEDIIKKDITYIAKCTRAPYFPIVADRAEGIYVFDKNNKKYIDMISSACVMNTGYSHREILKAVNNQINSYIHFSNDYFYTEPQVELAEKLAKIVPGNYHKKVIFGFAGSDSIDTAIKLARAYTSRSKIISYIGSYHGSTYGAISVSAIDLNMKRKIGPLLPEVYHLPYPIYNEDCEKTEDEYAVEAFKEFEKNFKYYIPKEEVAGIIIEPIIGDLGLIKPPTKYLKLLKTFCRENGILLIVDEIQQGFGRTGKWFSIEHFDIVPDIIVMGKAMGSGFPISAAVAKDEIIDSIKMPGQLFTLQGNAVCAVAAIETINVIKKYDLLNNAIKIGNHIKKRFEKISKKTGLIKEIRDCGLTIGVELNKGNDLNQTDVVKKICYRCFEKGVILIYLNGNTLRVQPPIIINQKEADEAMDIIESVFDEYIEGKISNDILEDIKGW